VSRLLPPLPIPSPILPSRRTCTCTCTCTTHKPPSKPQAPSKPCPPGCFLMRPSVPATTSNLAQGPIPVPSQAPVVPVPIPSPPPQRQNLHHHHPLLDTPTHTPLLSLCQPTRSSTRSRAQRNLSHRRTAKHSTARRSSLGCNCQYIAVLRCHCCCCRIALVRYRVVPEFPFTPLSCTRFPTLRASAPALDVSRASSCAF
jgi:hypothetical protein